MIGIYKITSPSNRVYIGQSVDIPKRWIAYNRLDCKNQPKLYRSFVKYGVENHIFEVIVECDVSNLNQLERFHQEDNKAMKHGLNCFLTKTKDKSGLMCETVKRKIGDAQRGELNHNFGKKASKETLLKLSKIRKGRKMSPEAIEKIRQANSGRKASDETRRIQSELKLGIVTWNKGIPMTEEAKTHLSTLNKGKYAGGKHNMAKKVINIKTNEVHSNAKELAESLNIKPATFRSWLRGSRTNKSIYTYL